MSRFERGNVRRIKGREGRFVHEVAVSHTRIITPPEADSMEFQSTANLGIIYCFPEWTGDMYESLDSIADRARN
jgi:hypothetical protein